MSEQNRFQEEHHEFMARWLERRQDYIGKKQENTEAIQSETKDFRQGIEKQTEEPVEVEPMPENNNSEDIEVEKKIQDAAAVSEPTNEPIEDIPSESKDEHEEELHQQPIVGNYWTEEENVSENIESIERTIRERNSIFKDIPSLVWLKSFPILLLTLSLLVLSIYFVSPYSKEKQIDVEGAQVLTSTEIEEFSQITANDYVLTFWLFKEDYAKNIVNSSPLVKSAQINYQFPNRFVIRIEEYATVGYIKREENYYSVLANGAILGQAYTGEALLGQFTTINLQDQDLIKKLALQLAELDSSLRTNIQTIDLTPSAVTSDLLTLNLYDGNKVVVPLTELGEKMVYYPKIAPQLTVASTIDMEVGIFSYPTDRVEETTTEEVASDEIITENSE